MKYLRYGWTLLGAYFDFFTEVSKKARNWALFATFLGVLLMLCLIVYDRLPDEEPLFVFLFFAFCLGPVVWLPILFFVFGSKKRDRQVFIASLKARIAWWYKNGTKSEHMTALLQKEKDHLVKRITMGTEHVLTAVDEAFFLKEIKDIKLKSP